MPGTFMRPPNGASALVPLINLVVVAARVLVFVAVLYEIERFCRTLSDGLLRQLIYDFASLVHQFAIVLREGSAGVGAGLLAIYLLEDLIDLIRQTVVPLRETARGRLVEALVPRPVIRCPTNFSNRVVVDHDRT